LSEAIGVPGFTFALHEPWMLPGTETFGGHVITGDSTSLTRMVNEQDGPADVVQLTLVVPTGKNEPETGLQITVPQPALVVGLKLTTAPQ